MGINFFDTAPLHGTVKKDGIAKFILGKGLRICRKEVIVSIKFGRKPTEGYKVNFNGRYARRSVEESLQRLATDYIDLLFSLAFFGARNRRRRVGELRPSERRRKVRFIGHSISKFEDTQDMARAWAKERKIDVIQVVYNLLNRESTELIDDLGSAGIGVVARESLVNGFLSGSLRRDSTFTPETLNARYTREEIEARVERVAALPFLVRDPVENMAQAALRWVLDNPCVSLVLTGAKNAAEVCDISQATLWPAFAREEIDRAARLHISDFPAT